MVAGSLLGRPVPGFGAALNAVPSIDAVRPIRGDIERRVRRLLGELGIQT